MFTVPALRPLVTVARIAYFRFVSISIAMWGPLYRRFPRSAAVVAPRHVSKIAAAITSCDVVFAVPGGYLLGPRATSDSWLFHVPTLELAHALGKPIALGPCSFGPFHKIYSRTAARVLEKVDVVCVREEISRGIIEQLQPARRPAVVSAPDMAFWFFDHAQLKLPSEIEKKLAASSTPILGISVRSHYFAGASDPRKSQQDYLKSIADAVAALATENQVRVWIIPQTQEDLGPGLQLSSLLTGLQVAHENIQDDLTFEQLRSMYSRLRLLLGTRMHANILAITAGTPVVAIAYEPKTTGILEAMNLSEWGIDIDALGGGRLRDVLTTQWHNALQLRLLALEKAREQADRIDNLWEPVSQALSSTSSAPLQGVGDNGAHDR